MDHDHGDHDHHHGSSTDGECVYSHALVFHTGVCQEILFPGWVTSNGLQIFGSAFALFVAGLLYEGLKYFRESLHSNSANNNRDSQVNITKSECGPNSPCAQTAIVKYSMFSSGHVIQTLLHIIQTTCSYILMLVFMTYNVWLCGGLVLGMGVGYFLFGWKKNNVVDTSEHCQ